MLTFMGCNRPSAAGFRSLCKDSNADVLVIRALVRARGWDRGHCFAPTFWQKLQKRGLYENEIAHAISIYDFFLHPDFQNPNEDPALNASY